MCAEYSQGVCMRKDGICHYQFILAIAIRAAFIIIIDTNWMKTNEFPYIGTVSF